MTRFNKRRTRVLSLIVTQVYCLCVMCIQFTCKQLILIKLKCKIYIYNNIPLRQQSNFIQSQFNDIKEIYSLFSSAVVVVVVVVAKTEVGFYQPLNRTRIRAFAKKIT